MATRAQPRGLLAAISPAIVAARPSWPVLMPSKLRTPLWRDLLRLLAGRGRAPLDPRRVTPGLVLAALLALLAGDALIDRLLTPSPRDFEPWGIGWGLAQWAWLALAALLAAALLGRSVLFPALLAFLALATLCVGALLVLIEAWLPPIEWVPAALQAALTLGLLRRAVDRLDSTSPWPRRSLAALAGAGLVLAAHLLLPRVAIWTPAWTAEPAASLSGAEAEALMFVQRERIDAALAALAPQRAGTIDLYVVGFAGDGSERVFAQEVGYAAALFGQRFGATGRTLVLANDLRDPQARPLATLAGLRHALTGLARIMDPDEDLLLLWLSSHGSEHPELFVHLPPLRPAQIDPQTLRAALDEAGIRWRIVVISACYSGGFIDALADDSTLVITAARADRESFGCGPDAEITWFGRAFLVEALNAVADPIQAFELARRRIDAWEREAGFTSSLPQLRSAPLLEIRLAQWLEALEPGPPLPFAPDGD